jgi:hypothetical protein
VVNAKTGFHQVNDRFQQSVRLQNSRGRRTHLRHCFQFRRQPFLLGQRILRLFKETRRLQRIGDFLADGVEKFDFFRSQRLFQIINNLQRSDRFAAHEQRRGRLPARRRCGEQSGFAGSATAVSGRILRLQRPNTGLVELVAGRPLPLRLVPDIVPNPCGSSAAAKHPARAAGSPSPAQRGALNRNGDLPAQPFQYQLIILAQVIFAIALYI